MCGTIAKVIMVVLNVAFLLGSLAMIGVGIALIVDPEGMVSFAEGFGLDFSTVSEVTGGQFDNILHAGGWFMIALGFITGIISIVGFCGAYKDSSTLLNVYAIFMLAIVAAEVALIVFVILYPRTLTDKGGEVMREALIKSFRSDVQVDSQGALSNASLSAADVAWFVTQLKLECCGGESYEDYQTFTNWKTCGTRCSSKIVPVSCCKLKSEIDRDNFPQNVTYFTDFDGCMSEDEAVAMKYRNSQGCWPKIVNEIENVFSSRNTIAIIFAGIIIGVEIALAIIACCAK